MDSTYFLRQLDVADLAKFKDKPITVVGAGGIGPATVVAWPSRFQLNAELLFLCSLCHLQLLRQSKQLAAIKTH